MNEAAGIAWICFWISTRASVRHRCALIVNVAIMLNYVAV